MIADARFFVDRRWKACRPPTPKPRVLPFPSQEVDPYRGLLPHFDVASARARALHALATGHARRRRRVGRGAAADAEPARAAAADVGRAGARRRDRAAGPAGAARRAPGSRRRTRSTSTASTACAAASWTSSRPATRYPVRVEFIGDTIESIRRFDPATQRSVATLDRVPSCRCASSPRDESAGRAARARPDRDVLRLRAARVRAGFAIAEEAAVDEHGRSRRPAGPRELRRRRRARADGRRARRADRSRGTRVQEHLADGRAARAARHRRGRARTSRAGAGTSGTSPASRRWSSAGGCRTGSPRSAARASARTRCVFVVGTSGRAERTIELLREYELPAIAIERAETTRGTAVLVAQGRALARVPAADAGLVLFAEADVFDEDRQRQDRRKTATGTFLSDFRDLKIGDYVVHVDHGIGVFVGLKTLSRRHRDAGVHGAPLRRRGQAVRPRRAARSRPAVLGRHASRRSTGSAARRGRRPRPA